MLGQLFLFVCVIAMFAVAGILFVVFGPLPVKRRVTVISRLSAGRSSAPRFAPQWASPPAASMPAPAASMSPPAASISGPVSAPSVPSLVSQLAPARDQAFSTDTDFLSEAAPVEVPAMSLPARKPKGARVQPLPKKRAAKGTDSPFAPVVRSRSQREEELATNPVRVVSFDTGEMTTVDDL